MVPGSQTDVIRGTSQSNLSVQLWELNHALSQQSWPSCPCGDMTVTMPEMQSQSSCRQCAHAGKGDRGLLFQEH